MEYFEIYFGYGNVMEIMCEDLDEAKEIADKHISYTQTGVKICDIAGKVLAIRRWYGVELDTSLYEESELEEIIPFGEFGYYDTWEDYDVWRDCYDI